VSAESAVAQASCLCVSAALATLTELTGKLPAATKAARHPRTLPSCAPALAVKKILKTASGYDDMMEDYGSHESPTGSSQPG